MSRLPALKPRPHLKAILGPFPTTLEFKLESRKPWQQIRLYQSST
jgi:hypothetical protein